jgi:DNA polymerase III delta prime subunit
MLIDTYKNTGSLHHAYIIEGDRTAVREALFSFIEKDVKENIQGNPDFWHGQFETFTIDDARKLQEAQAMKAFSDNRKIFILELNGMTHEAQNALLKAFEEPTPSTHFFIIAPSREIFLPTLRSRVQIISDTTEGGAGTIDPKEFLMSTPAKRLELIADIVEEKNKAEAVHLVNGIIVALSESKQEIAKEIYSELLKCRGYLNDRSPSVKLILEHLSLITPIVK